MDTRPKQIEDVIAKVKEYVRNEQSIALILSAYNLAHEKHHGQLRKSSEPYIQHPIEVAYMLAEYRTSPATIIAGLLHDIVEDTDVTKEDLALKFGTDVANIVDGVTKIGQLKYMTKAKALARSHQKILLAMAKDIRVVLVKLIDRMHNMRTLEFHTPEKQQKIARETMELYAPLAHRLGMYRIKAELEDLSFKYLLHDEYEQLTTLICSVRDVQEEDIHTMQDRIDEILKQNKIFDFSIKGRIKNIYSIYKKMNQKQIDFDQIYDLMALRVLLPSIEDCYRVLGLIHSEWTPLPMRFKDYIAIPKPNLYQSLHTTVVGGNGKVFEVQIRTYKMDEVAELGIAAHWAYKEDNKNYTPQQEQLEIAAKLKWYKDLLTYAEIGESEDQDPLKDIKEDIFSANVYVFTPNGDVMDFPAGATPLDFAYRIHTEIGNKTVGAIVNKRIVPLTYKLKTGDVVEIKTNKNSPGPSESWLKIVKTSHARHKIKTVLNRQKRDILVAKGKEDFERIIKAESILIPPLEDKLLQEHFSKNGVNNIEDFYFEIGKSNLSARGAANKLSGNEQKLDEETMVKQLNEANAKKSKRQGNDYGIIVEGLDKTHIKLANCCHPIMGDNIVGYVSKGQGIIVHRFECINVKNAEEQRFIDVIWDEDFDKKVYDTQLKVYSFDRKNIVADMINIINATVATITSISSSKTKGGDLLTKIKLTVSNVNVLQNVISNLNKVSDIYTIERNIK